MTLVFSLEGPFDLISFLHKRNSHPEGQRFPLQHSVIQFGSSVRLPWKCTSRNICSLTDASIGFLASCKTSSRETAR